MALFDTPRIFKTPAEEANEAASRVSALGLGQLFAHAFEGAQARAQQQLQFEEQMAQRKIEYQNNLDRLKQQQQLETDKWELGKKLENLQINQLQNKLDEDKAFADDLTVFQSWQKTLNEDPNAPIPLDAMKSDRGKQLLINWRQQKINQNMELISKTRDQDMQRSLTPEGFSEYEIMMNQLQSDAANGLPVNYRAKNDFWNKAKANGWVVPYGQYRYRQTDAERVVEATRLAAIARENGDDIEADRQEQIARIYANKSKAVFPEEQRFTPQQRAAIAARKTVILQRYRDARDLALGDPDLEKAAEDQLAKDELDLLNMFPQSGVTPATNISAPPVSGSIQKMVEDAILKGPVRNMRNENEPNPTTRRLLDQMQNLNEQLAPYRNKP